MAFNHVMRWPHAHWCIKQLQIVAQALHYHNHIAKWRLGAWDVQELPLEADQPAPGPNIENQASMRLGQAH